MGRLSHIFATLEPIGKTRTITVEYSDKARCRTVSSFSALGLYYRIKSDSEKNFREPVSLCFPSLCPSAYD